MSDEKVVLAQRMHASDEPASILANTQGVSRATLYRALSADDQR